MAGPYALSGTGIQNIVTCVWLQVTVTAINPNSRNGRAFPTYRFDQAFITPGNANGYYNAIPVSESPMLIPVTPDVDRFGFACLGGAQLSVTELGVPTKAESPWDRNPLPKLLAYEAQVPGGTVNAQRFHYAVPANRLALVTRAMCQITRMAAPTSPSSIIAYMTTTYGDISSVNMFGGAVDDVQQDSVGGYAFLLLSGDYINGYAGNSDNGGNAYISMLLAAIEFDK